MALPMRCTKHGYDYIQPDIDLRPPGQRGPLCPLCRLEWLEEREKVAEATHRAVLRERLASLCHEQWSGWMAHLFMHGTYGDGDGSFTINADKVARWHRQLETDYADLPEDEQDSDRTEADKFLRLLGRAVE